MYVQVWSRVCDEIACVLVSGVRVLTDPTNNANVQSVTRSASHFISELANPPQITYNNELFAFAFKIMR